MATALVASTKVAGGSGGTTPAIDTTGANFLVVMMAWGGTATLSDNKGNTFTAGTQYSSTAKGQLFYCANATVGTGHTFTITGASTASSIVAAAFSDVATSSTLDDQTGGSSSGTSCTFGAANKTPSVDNCLIINGHTGEAPAWTGLTAGSGWTQIDNNPFASGTNYGSSMLYKVQTTATQLLSSQVTETWTGSTSFITTSIIFKPLVGGGGAITLTDVVDFRIVQRSGTTGSLAIAGTHTGATSVEARIVEDGTSTEVVTWTTIDASPGASTFSGTLTGIPQGAWYNVQVRQGNDTAVVSNGANAFGVGCLVAVAGQSQGVHWFSDGTTHTPDPYLVQYTGSAGTGWADRTTTGNGVNAFGNALRTELGGTIPVGMLSYAVGATALDTLANGGSGYWMNTAGGSPYAVFKAGVISTGGKLEAVIWMQGEQDGYSTLVSEALYQSDLETLFARMRTDFGQASLPIVVSPLAGYTNAGPTDASWEGIRQAQITVGKQTNNTLAALNQDIPLVDGVHYTTTGYTTHGTRAAVACANALGLNSYARGPVIASAVLATSTTVEINLTHRGGTDFTPTTGITGFLIYDDGVAKTITGVVRTNATTITATVSTAITGVGTLRYQYGKNPTISAPALDNTAETLPIGLESGALMTILAGTPIKCTILTSDGVIRQILDAELGTGKKPLVLDGNRWRQRQAAEGTAIVYANSRFRLIEAGEELQV